MSETPGPNGVSPPPAPTTFYASRPRSPPGVLAFFRVALLQAFWICLIYSAFGISFDVMRRLTHRDFWNRATLFVDAPALTALRHLEVLHPLVAAAAHGTASPFVLRLVISTCTFVGIFIQAFLLSGILYAAIRIFYWRSRGPADIHSQ